MPTIDVQGYHDGVFYSANMVESEDGLDITGSLRAQAMVSLYAGTTVMVGPDQVKADDTTIKGALAALFSATNVVQVSGDVPQYGPDGPGDDTEGLVR